MSESPSLSPQKHQLAWLAAALGLLVLVVYSPVLSGGFLNYDDPLYVTGNNVVRQGLSPSAVAWAFTTSHSYNWHPVTWLSHMLDVQLYGMNPLGHHLTNLLFHLANSLVLFALLKKWTGAAGKSLFVAALFALHPLHVESVAWISERKDVLSTLFWLLTMWAYGEYVKDPKFSRYLAVLCFLVLGLMSKPMLVTLPFVLLLVDYWPLRRLAHDGPASEAPCSRGWGVLVVEKLPLLGLAVISCVVTYLAQEKGGALSYHVSLGLSTGNALISYVRYLANTLFPIGLAVYYPFDPEAVTLVKVAGACALLLFASLLVLRCAKRRPYLITGWFWYLGTLVPVIGIVKIGQHALADRYSYVPLIGIFILVAWGVDELAARWRVRKEVLVMVSVVVVAALSLATWRQAGYWHDSVTLFSRALAVTDKNWLAHKNLAKAYSDRDNYQEALYHISASLQIKPDPVQYVSESWLYSKLGEYEKSNESCRKALAMAPDNEKAHFLAGMNYLALKQYPAAIAEYRILLAGNSRFVSQVLSNLLKAGIDPAAVAASR